MHVNFHFFPQSDKFRKLDTYVVEEFNFRCFYSFNQSAIFQWQKVEA